MPTEFGDLRIEQFDPARMFMTMKQVRAIVGEPAAAG
jgi:hypothetical protein